MVHVTMLKIEGVSVQCTSPSTPAMNVNAPCTKSPASHLIVRKECGPSIISHGGRCNSCFIDGINL
jgi:prepilin-type processing-associated H-X9-DG protein